MGRKYDGVEGSVACELVAPQLSFALFSRVRTKSGRQILSGHSVLFGFFFFALPLFSDQCVPLCTTNASWLHSVNASLDVWMPVERSERHGEKSEREMTPTLGPTSALWVIRLLRWEMRHRQRTTKTGAGNKYEA